MPNNQNPENMAMITFVLAVASAVGPIVFGFAVWKMSQIFVSKEQFDAYKQSSERERADMRDQLKFISDKVVELLQRTAEKRDK